MGQELSSHELFITGLKTSLKTRGIKARKKDLRKFFEFLSSTCPWFPQEGTIDVRCWQRVGNALQDFYASLGPEKVPVSTFNYWSLINDVLKVHSHDPDIEKIIQAGEAVLRQASRPPSACGSVSIDIPNLTETNPPNSPPENRISDINPSPAAPTRLYPCLSGLSDPSDSVLPPEDQATLDDEAARYHQDDPPVLSAAPLPRPPPYNPTNMPPPVAPVRTCFPPHETVVEPPPLMPNSLSQQIATLQKTLEERRQHLSLLKELRALESELASLSPSTPPPPTVRSSRGKPVLAFPVTRGRAATAAPDTQTPEDPDEEPPGQNPPNPDPTEENSDPDNSSGDDEEEGPPSPPPRRSRPPSRSRAWSPSERASPGRTSSPSHSGRQQRYRPLNIKYLKDLKSAVHTYGPTAPFTLALLESLTDRWLTPNDWFTLAHAALSGGDFVLWRTEYAEKCREMADRNSQSRSSRSWTRDRLLGRGAYSSNENQAAFPPGLLAQIQNAGLQAWRKLPPKGPVGTSLAKIHQGADEPYCDFISRLTDAAERLIGKEESESAFVKHLAFQNANPACQEALRAYQDTPLSNYIKLCAGIGSSHALGLAIGALLTRSDKPQSDSA